MRFEYTGPAPLTIDFAARPVDPASGRRVFTGVPVEEGRLFTAELLGISDGTPDQRFPLAHPGLILRPPGAASAARDITVLTQLGPEVTEWTLRETLAFSQAAQHDVMVQIDADDRTTVLFGNGQFGAKPDVGATVTATYRVGGGAAGNVPAGTVTTIVDAPPLARARRDRHQPSRRHRWDAAGKHRARGPARPGGLPRAAPGGDRCGLRGDRPGVQRGRQGAAPSPPAGTR